MSSVVNSVQYRCDWCGVISAERPLAESGIIVESELPEGWVSIGYGSARLEPSRFVELKDSFGQQITHLCPGCSARPAGELLSYLGHVPAGAPA